MHINLTETMFKDAFRQADRLDNFSYEGLTALYDWFTELEEDTGEPMGLDVIAICCEFSEEPIDGVLENYSLDNIDALYDETIVVAQFGDKVLYQAY